MGRKQKVSDDIILNDLKSGLNDRQTALKEKVDTSTVRQRRLALEEKGLLPKRQPYQRGLKGKVTKVAKSKGNGGIALEKLINDWTVILAKASKAEILEERVNRLENQLAAARNSIKILEEDKQEREQKARQFRLAQQQGELPKLTEHIYWGFPYVVRESALCLT